MDMKNLLSKMTQLNEDREVKTNIGKYGTEYQGDDDEDEDGKKVKKAAPATKRGRGRPRKDADNTGHVAKHNVDKKTPAWLKGGDAPKSKPNKEAVKKHSLKDWFEHMTNKMIAEEMAMAGQQQRYTTAPSKPGGMDIKDQQGKTVATAKNPQAAEMFKKGDIKMTAPDDIQEAGDDRKAIFKAKMMQHKKKVAEADMPVQDGNQGAGLGAGRSQRSLEEAKKDKKPSFGGKQAEAFGKKKKKEDVPDDIQEAAKPDFLDKDKDGNKKESMKKAVKDDKKKKKVSESAHPHRMKAAHHMGKSHALAKSAYNCHFDDMDEARMYHDGYKEGLDECYGQLPIQGLGHEPAAMESTVDDMASFGALHDDGPGFDRSPNGGQINKIAFEALDKQLNALLDEGMTVSISKGQQGAPDSVSVTASDADSDKLLAAVRQAGLGLFGGDDNTMQPGAIGSNMPSQATQGEPGTDIAVVDDHDDMMSLIKKVTGDEPQGGGEGFADAGVDTDSGASAEEPAGEEDAGEEIDVDSVDSGSEEGDSSDDNSEEVVDEVESEDQMTDEVAEESDAQADEETEAAEDNAIAQSDVPDDIQEEKNDVPDDIQETYANGTDDTFEADINFITKAISGGLNKQKETGQTTAPVVASQGNRLGSSMSESNDLLKDWKTLSGIK